MELQHAYDTVNVHRNGGELRIELNRPESMNAWNTQFGLDLLAAIEDAKADDVRAVTIVAAGRGFSSGADLKDGFEPRESDGRPDVGTALRERYHPILLGIRELPKPVVAAVQGPAVGIGCSLALCCDLVLAREDAYFLLAFVNIGLVPDGGSSAYIPAKVGLARATQMAMLGERVGARQALDWGLINAVHPEAEFDDAVDALAARLAAGPTRSYAGTKRQLNRWVFGDLAEQLEFECSIQEEMAGTDDFLEGVSAFVEKRSSAFKGA